MTEYQEVTLETLAGGAAAEKFGRELSKVLANIEDENTKARAKRSVTLKLTITPNEDRSFCGVNVEDIKIWMMASGLGMPVIG